MTACRKPVVGKRNDHRYQTEDGCADRDDGKAVHVSWRHRCLYQEVVVLGRLLHVIHFSAGARVAPPCFGVCTNVLEWANLVSYRSRMWW